jgi:1,4-dihydroxy-2-naphthoate octaprenyltransferase
MSMDSVAEQVRGAVPHGVAGRVRTWLQASRAKSLAISSIAVLTGIAVAGYEGHWHSAVLLAWLGAIAAQAGTNLVNVSYNYKGTGRPGASFDPKGSSAPVHTGILTATQVRNAGLLCFGVAVATGVPLISLRGIEILALGIPGVLAGFFYAAPPLRLAYRAMGVITVFIFMGPVMVAGTYYVASGQVSPAALLAAIPVGLLAAGVMHTNDLRDYESDVRFGKRTLATLIGRDGAVYLHIGILTAAYVALLAAVVTGFLPWPTVAVVLTAPVAVRQARLIHRERDPARLNEAWFHGVQLHTQFGLLLIGALVVSTTLHL